MAIVSAIETDAQDFLDKVWIGGDLFIDEEETFKKALGGGAYRNWWLLKPSVLRHLTSYARNFGFQSNDVSDKKTQTLGGTFVVKNGEVVYVHKETSTFDNGDARAMLAAVTGKDINDLPTVASAPATEEACARRQ